MVLLLSWIRARGLRGLLEFIPARQRRPIDRMLRLHRTLMLFFVVGYVVVMIALVFDYPIVSGTFVSAIFFSGAAFVLIGVDVQTRLLSEVQSTLSGMLPICARCKKIRSPDGNPADPTAWKAIETYIEARADVAFSHGYCPDCGDAVIRGAGSPNHR